MRRRYLLLPLACLLGWFACEPQPTQSVSPQRQLPHAVAPSGSATPTAQTPPAQGLPAPVATAAPSADWQAIPEEMSQQLASEISRSDLPLAERLANLATLEAQWLDGKESLIGLQGRYALALTELANASEQLPLAERVAALTALQDQWAAQYPALASDLFNPDARLLQARQLWGDDELATLAQHFLPAANAEATLQFANQRQQQLAQRDRYQQQLAALEQQLTTSQGGMAGADWQQHRDAVISQWRQDFFAREQGQP
ncbi:hypothetical protein [Aeromonas cavernicola]|uniref:Uncharacterized protein n=1 Tax=Aeromonas cavernicola TaxID=1006623 RepID=A0A2H9U1C1_9GAMM|nr:hypothetical protein [Aeromonas cavernicola]PJG57800.1 hypothetical protein CUC53_16080 [Aeromonas cavernicola]